MAQWTPLFSEGEDTKRYVYLLYSIMDAKLRSFAHSIDAPGKAAIMSLSNFLGKLYKCIQD
ncbi:hypothetical protein NBRC116589_06430 [Ruegeria sp. HU-ET01832]